MNDYRLIHSPVCPIEILRLLLSIVITKNYCITTADVNTAFLNSDIDIEIYVRIPQGINLDPNKYKLALHKAIYGLRISAKKWFEKITQVLEEAMFQQLYNEPCLFYKRCGSDIIILGIYVDDTLIIANALYLIDELIDVFNANFRVKVDRKPSVFLGIKLYYMPDNTLQLSQESYIKQLAQLYNVGDHPETTPMEAGLVIQKSTIHNDCRQFRGMIGALLHVARFTPPDIMAPVNLLAHQLITKGM